MFPEKLQASEYGNDDDIKFMLDCFDKSTKRVFEDPVMSSYIKFGAIRCNDPAVGISHGQLTLSG